MKKSFLKTALVGLAFLFAQGLLANVKVAVFDMQQIILNVEEGKVERTKLQKEIEGKEAEFLGKKKELDELNKDWKGQATLLSEEARMRKQTEFQEKFMQLRNAEMEFQQSIKEREMEATKKIAMNVTNIVGEFGDKRGFDLVFETNSSGLVYVREPVDITKELIERYNTDAAKGLLAKGATAKKPS